MNAYTVKQALRTHASTKRAKLLSGYFKTGKGEYGEGDRFLGITVPQVRSVVKEFRGLPLPETEKLIRSPWHEDRLCGLLILVDQFQRGDQKTRKRIYDAYLTSTAFINNWDLVDLSAPKIVGAYLADKPRNILISLAGSKDIWERRIAILATAHFIFTGDFKDALRIARMLRDDPHDLIHKAVGWMLREIGKRDVKTLKTYLNEHGHRMPRTMLRYAIEKFPEKERKAYLAKKG